MFDSYEFNKIAGAVLGTALAVFGLKMIAGFVYDAEKPAKPGFMIAEAEASDGAAPEAAGEVKPVGVLLASASAEKGQAIAKPCLGCHDLSNAGTNKTGPGLWGLVGRNIASHEGYGYSEALAARKGETWDYDKLNQFLINPKGYIPGTKMAIAIKNDQKRADLLAYLGSLSDKPVPFPPAQ